MPSPPRLRRNSRIFLTAAILSLTEFAKDDGVAVFTPTGSFRAIYGHSANGTAWYEPLNPLAA